MIDVIRNGLKEKIDQQLVDKLLESYVEAKNNFYLGKLRANEVEGGRFCEAAFRILENIAFVQFTPIGTPLKTDEIIQKLARTPTGSHPDSIRLHIPRTLRVIYDIRNKRDVAHLGNEVDPNVQDATIVCSCLDWVLAELVRIYHSVSADEAQKIVEDLVTKKVPIIQEFSGVVKVLKPNLGASDFCLAILYHKGAAGATIEDLTNWVKPSMRANLRRTLRVLEHDKSAIHFGNGKYFITQAGESLTEVRKILS